MENLINFKAKCDQESGLDPNTTCIYSHHAVYDYRMTLNKYYTRSEREAANDIINSNRWWKDHIRSDYLEKDYQLWEDYWEEECDTYFHDYVFNHLPLPLYIKDLHPDDLIIFILDENEIKYDLRGKLHNYDDEHTWTFLNKKVAQRVYQMMKEMFFEQYIGYLRRAGVKTYPFRLKLEEGEDIYQAYTRIYFQKCILKGCGKPANFTKYCTLCKYYL